MFKKAGEPSKPLRPRTFTAILTDAGKVSKVGFGECLRNPDRIHQMDRIRNNE